MSTMVLDSSPVHALPPAPDARSLGLPLARGPPPWPASCDSYPLIRETHSDNEPWTAAGISRATWYRRSREVPPEPPAPLDDVTRWYCIRTAFGREKEADTAVRVDGFTVFNPSEFKEAISPRRDSTGVMRPGKPARVVPLLGRYFFVQLCLADPYWYQIKRHPSVDRVMSGTDLDSGGYFTPIAIPDRAIAWLRERLDENGCFYKNRLREIPIGIGVPVVLTEGPMTGRTGICDESDGLQVRLSMIVMGHLVKLSVAQSWCEPIK